MRIGIDARTILNPEIGEAAGLGHYTYQLIRHLLKVDQDLERGKNEYVLFFDNRVRRRDVQKFTQKNVKIRHFPFSTHKKYLPGVYSEFLIAGTLAREKLDILHSPGGEIPLIYRAPTVITARNLALFKYPELFSKTERIMAKVMPRAPLKKAKIVIATSKAAKEDLVHLSKIDPEKIKVIYKGFDKRFFQDATDKEIKEIKNKYNIRGKYLLFMSTIKPSNNLTRLIQAFAQFKKLLSKKNLISFQPGEQSQHQSQSYQLVLAGKDGWLAKEIHQIAEDYNLKKSVILTGYIPPEGLNSLFNGAELFIFPSLYEEFGTPVLEAMASGIPVITSNVSSLPEITNGAAELVDPYDTKGLANKILEVISSKELQEDLKKKGLERAKEFSWEECARQTLEVYREAVNL